MKNIIFRVDSSSLIGNGHIMRSLVLAKQYKDANIIFATQKLEGHINHKIIEDGYAVELLNSNKLTEFIEVIKKYSVNYIVIDSYEIDYEYEKSLKKQIDVKILVFDDTYEKHYCDILLNHNISADKIRYKGLVPVECELRCGKEFTLLRSEFLVEFPPKISNSKINVLVAMGGVDSRELNIKILELLSEFQNMEIHLITTRGNKNLQKLEEYVLSRKNVDLHIDTSTVASLMYSADFVILTPSVTVNEAYHMNLPFIAVQTAENQKDVREWLCKNNYLTLEHYEKEELFSKIILMLDMIGSVLINFTNLMLDDKRLVLNWRNSESIKKWMFHRENIEIEEHLAYIERLKAKKDRVYFLVKLHEKPLGVVDLTDIKQDGTAELGIYTNPDLKGYGTLLMHKILDYAFKHLRLKALSANVYKQNIKAIKLYERFNFQIVNNIRDENGELLKMELKNENR